MIPFTQTLSQDGNNSNAFILLSACSSCFLMTLKRNKYMYNHYGEDKELSSIYYKSKQVFPHIILDMPHTCTKLRETVA